jgi:hypothetical protein
VRNTAEVFAAAFLSIFGSAMLEPWFFRANSDYECLNVARSLALHHSFADPFNAAATGPTAHVAPLFPLLISPVHLLKVHPAFPLMILSGLLLACICAMLPRLSEDLFGVRGPGIWAAALGILGTEPAPQHDHLLGAALCVWACCLILEGRKTAPIVSGLAWLASPVNLIPTLILAHKYSKTKYRIAIVSVAMCVPWVIRGYVVMGSVFPIRDNFPLEFAVSNNECAKPTFNENFLSGCYATVHPNLSEAEAVRLREVGEVRYGKQRLSAALEWVRSNKERFVKLTLQRQLFYFFPPALEHPWAYATWLTTAVAILALAFRFVPLFSPLPLIALLTWMPYLVIQSELRFRDISLWAWCLMAGVLIDAMACRVTAPSD